MRILFGAVLIFASHGAMADIRLEPYAGYYLGTSEFKVKATDAQYKNTANGFGFGGRLAYYQLGLWGGVDYFYASTKIKYTEPTDQEDLDGTGNTFFLVAGYDFVGIPIRIFGGYGLMNSMSAKNSSGTTDWTGTAYKIGGGFKVIPLLSINIEYIVHNLTKYKVNGQETDVSQTYDNYKNSGVFISASVPLTF